MGRGGFEPPIFAFHTTYGSCKGDVRTPRPPAHERVVTSEWDGGELESSIVMDHRPVKEWLRLSGAGVS